MTALLQPAAPGRWSRGPQEQLHTEPLNQDPSVSLSPRRGQNRASSSDSSASPGPAGQLDLPVCSQIIRHSPTPQSSLSDAVYSRLLHTDWSRESDEVRVRCLRVKWELLSFSETLWGKQVMWVSVPVLGFKLDTESKSEERARGATCCCWLRWRLWTTFLWRILHSAGMSSATPGGQGLFRIGALELNLLYVMFGKALGRFVPEAARTGSDLGAAAMFTCNRRECHLYLWLWDKLTENTALTSADTHSHAVFTGRCNCAV